MSSQATHERQIQLSQWTYRDKMETLFIYQLLFLGIMTTCLFAVLARIGFFDDKVVYLVGAMVLLVVGLVWYFRTSYTKGVRDKYTWDRRYFNDDFTKASVVSPAELAAAARQSMANCRRA